MNVLSKSCNRCGVVKPLEEFTPQAKGKYGRLGRCKECMRNVSKEWDRAHPDQRRSYSRKWNKQHPDYYREWALAHPESRDAACKKWQERNKDKYRAHWMVRNALKDGRLQRMPCVVCGSKAHAHHPDYANPLSVVWLCPKHHKEEHASSHRR